MCYPLHMSLHGTEEIKDQALVDDAVAANVADFEEKLRDHYTESQVKQIRTVGAFIMQGMDVEESCVLSRLDPRMFATWVDTDPALRTFVVFKQTAYKAKLMGVLTSRAIEQMNEKLAGWILERKYREEWGSKRVAEGPESAQDALQEGIEYVRTHGDSSPVVDHSRTLPDAHIVDVTAMVLPKLA